MITINFCINKKIIRLDYSFITCMKYRGTYGVSIIEEMENIKDFIVENPIILTRILERIIYVSIQNSKLTFDEFKNLARADEKFTLSALDFLKNWLLKDNFLKNDKQSKKKEEVNIKFDEYQIISIYSKLNLPEFLLRELNIFQVCELISINNEIFSTQKSDHKKYRKMSDSEMKSLYG